MLHLNIRKRRLMLRAIIHQLLATIYHTIIPHFFKCLVHPSNHIFVQRKSQVIPRAACTESPQLQFHIAALFLHEFPHLRIQLIP